MVKTFIAFWAILLQILWLEKADFFPSAAVGVSVQVSSEFMSGYMRKKPKQPTGNLLPTRKFLQYYEPSQSTSKSLPFRVFCQMVCEFCPVLNFFFFFYVFLILGKNRVECAEVLVAALCAFPQSCVLLLEVNNIFNSVQFSRSVVSNSLRSHEPQHARPPCPSPTPGVHSNSHPSSW